MSISIKDWVQKQNFTYYYIIPGQVRVDLINHYGEVRKWLTSSITGRWSTKVVRVDENNATIGGMEHLPRCIILFEKEEDMMWFILRWS